MQESFVYIMASKRNGKLYIGITSNLEKRVFEHKNKIMPGFTEKYEIGILVYYETFSNIEMAILREKRLKEWKRQWKIELIEKSNHKWIDLFEATFFKMPRPRLEFTPLKNGVVFKLWQCYGRLYIHIFIVLFYIFVIFDNIEYARVMRRQKYLENKTKEI